MMSTLRTILGGAVLATLAAGCGTSPPGAGFTSGDKPNLTSDEKPAIRDDLRDAPLNTGDAPLADSTALSPSGPGNNAGPGGRNMAPADPTPNANSSSVRATPPKIDSPTPNQADGATKPAGNINTGTPRSPQ